MLVDWFFTCFYDSDFMYFLTHNFQSLLVMYISAILIHHQYSFPTCTHLTNKQTNKQTNK